MKKIDSSRKDQFDRAVASVHREIKKEFFNRDVSHLHAAVDSAAEECFDRSLSIVTPYDPKNAYKRIVRSMIRQTIQAELDTVRQFIVEEQKREIEKEISVLEVFLSRIASVRVEVEQGVFQCRKEPRQALARRGSPSSAIPQAWRGADVIIVEQPLAGYRGGSTVVVTKHATALASLFYRLRDEDPGVLDYMSKYIFYGEMAEAAEEHTEQNEAPEQAELLEVTIDAAQRVLLGWKDQLIKECWRLRC